MAILARAMDIPTVMGAVELPWGQIDRRQLIVDGYRGSVYTDPGVERLKHYEAICLEEQELAHGREPPDTVCSLPADRARTARLTETWFC